MHRKHDVQAFSKHRQKHRRAMFLSEHRLNIPSLRNGKHPIVKNILSLRNVKIPQPYLVQLAFLGFITLLEVYSVVLWFFFIIFITFENQETIPPCP